MSSIDKEYNERVAMAKVIYESRNEKPPTEKECKEIHDHYHSNGKTDLADIRNKHR